MPYLIDGHNLIPHVRGLSLEQLDDEQALVARLEAHFQRERKQAVVYFDRAQIGSAEQKRAFLQVHFVRPPAIADTAILQHLKKLGGEARNWVVVSSDGNVRRGAQKAGARAMSSAAFAKLLEASSADHYSPPTSEKETDDITGWLEIFGRKS
jgi:predicted RNA-binding protein with PIN domain